MVNRRSVTIDADGEDVVLDYGEYKDWEVRVVFSDDDCDEGYSRKATHYLRGVNKRRDITKDVIQEAVDAIVERYGDRDGFHITSIKVVEEARVRTWWRDDDDD